MFKFEFESKEFDFIKYLKNEKKKHFLFRLALGRIHFLSPGLARPTLHRFFLTGPTSLLIARHPSQPVLLAHLAFTVGLPPSRSDRVTGS
jgi:hypothetical protein